MADELQVNEQTDDVNQEVDQEAEAVSEVKTFTQDEVNQLIAGRLAKEKKKIHLKIIKMILVNSKFVIQLYYKEAYMDTIVKSIRFTREEEQAISDYADFANKSFSDVVKSAILEKLEDDYDIKVGQEAYEEYLKNPVSYPIEELFEEFDI